MQSYYIIIKVYIPCINYYGNADLYIKLWIKVEFWSNNCTLCAYTCAIQE